MNKEELKPCPFCGGEAKIDKRWEYGYGIVCISCGAKSPDFQTETNAIKSWNDYAKDLLKMEQIEPEISLDGIHPDLINGVLEAKSNFPKLKPCPFCGGEAEVDYRLGLCSVVCKDCGARVSSFGDVNLAIEAWNRRNYLEKQDSSNSSEFPNSSKEIHKVPKWEYYNGDNVSCITIEMPFSESLDFRVYHKTNRLVFAYEDYDCFENICTKKEEIGTFNTLEEAKQKVNECIRELGEKLVYFANNIKM